MQVLPATFQATGPTVTELRGKYIFETTPGTVDVEFGGNTVTVKAVRTDTGNIYAEGFTGQYRSGAKVWKASVTFNATQNRTVVWFGRDDRAAKFNKEQCRSYNPAAYDAA